MNKSGFRGPIRLRENIRPIVSESVEENY